MTQLVHIEIKHAVVAAFLTEMRQLFPLTLGYHQGTGSTVETITFNTSNADELAIAQRIDDAGDPRGISCSRKVSGVLSGIGPFKKLDSYLFPGSLADELKRRGGISNIFGAPKKK
jgi:hypothetical protein